MNKTLKWGLILAALVALFFIVRLPATLAARALPQTVTLAGVEGSIWNGSASALGINGTVAQEKLRWHFEPATLLHGRLGWQIDGEFRGRPSSLHASLGLRQQSLDHVRLALPLDPLTRFNSTIEGVRLRGTVMLESEHLAQHDPINAVIRLEQVSTALAAEPTLLGGYQANLDVSPDGNGHAQIASLGGPLQINGGGSFALAKNAVDMKLLLRPTGDIPALASLLATLPREQDQYVIQIKRP